MMSSAADRTTSAAPEDYLDSVRAAYDAVAGPYASQFADELRDKPLDRGVIEAFVHRVRALGESAPVADLGCGPGHNTRFLLDAGLPVFGIDLSPAMVELARTTYPQVEFRTGSLLDIHAPDGCWSGVMSLYSIIHLPPDVVPAALAEFHRVLRPGGLLLLGFHAGDERLHVEEWFGRSVSLDGYLFDPDVIAGDLEGLGFTLEVRVRRLPYPDIEVQTERAYLLARRDAPGA